MVTRRSHGIRVGIKHQMLPEVVIPPLQPHAPHANASGHAKALHLRGFPQLELTTDPALQAAQRLELAVEKLAVAIERRFEQMRAAAANAAADSVPRAEVMALSARLDQAMNQLRGAMLDDEEQA